MSERLEDVFAGYVELTASERAYALVAITEFYMAGGRCPPNTENRREMCKRVIDKLIGPLKLEKMVTPDGSRLVTVAEHDAIVGVPHDQ